MAGRSPLAALSVLAGWVSLLPLSEQACGQNVETPSAARPPAILSDANPSTQEYLGPGPSSDPFDLQPYRPKMKLTIDALILDRSGVDSQTILLDAPAPGGNPLLDASELQSDEIWAGRFDLVIYDHGAHLVDYQLGYFLTEQSDVIEARSSSPADISFFSGNAASPVDTYYARYRTKLKGGEFSLRYAFHESVAVSGGLRFARLSESFDLLSSFAPVTGFYSDTKNDLFGFQLGTDMVLVQNRFGRIDAAIKGGVYNNDIEVYAKALNFDQTLETNRTAFLGEANVAWVIPAWPFDIRLGYQAIWLSGVALAPDQNDSLNIFTGAGSVDVGDPVYHGGIIGFEFVY